MIVVLVFISVAYNLVAQDEETDNREKFQFGLRAGVNSSNAYNSRTDEFRTDSKLGFAGGGFFRIPMTKYLRLQPETLLSQKGIKGEVTFLGMNYNFIRTTTFIDIPLQIAFNPSEFITIVAGPQYSFLINQKDVFNSPFYNTSYKEEFDNEEIRKNILGFVSGVDINIKHIIVSARVGWDILYNSGDRNSNTPQYKNMWFQGTIGYTLYKNKL